MRTWTALGVLAAIGLMLAGCNKTPPVPDPIPAGNAPTAATRSYTFAIIPKMLNNPVFALAQRGAQKAARDIAASDGVQVRIEYQSSQTGDPAEQAETIRRMASRGVDGMSISVVDANTVRGPINDAVAAGIHVMTFDSDAPGSDRLTFYAVSDEKLGREIAERLVEACGGALKAGDEIAILSGQASAPNLQSRVQGCMDVIRRYSGVKVLPTLYCDDDIAVAVDRIRNTMSAHPNLRGWLMVGGWPLFADNALDSINPQRTKVACVDALEKQWQYLEKGQAYCLVAQRPFSWGEESVKILYDLATGRKTDYADFVESEFDVIYLNPTEEQRAAAREAGKNLYSLVEYREIWARWSSEAGS